jgi:hypothetical protein
MRKDFIFDIYAKPAPGSVRQRTEKLGQPNDDASMKNAAICALLLMLPAAAAAAILESAYLPPAGDPAREAAPDRRKPVPAPAPTRHYAGARPPAMCPTAQTPAARSFILYSRLD